MRHIIAHAELIQLCDGHLFVALDLAVDPIALVAVENLILGSPGNYLKYYIGYIKFLELKKEWIKSGNQSQKEFHKAVLSVGPAPFEIVGKYFSL